MRDNRPQLLECLLSDANALYNIQQRAMDLLKLNSAVQALLPAQMRPWCRVANYRKGVLVLETANGSWLMRMRYEQTSLLTALRTGILPSLASIDIRINPTLMNARTEKTQSGRRMAINQEKYPTLRQLSTDSAEHLRCVAERSPKKLREKLERLASLAEKSKHSQS